MTEVIVLLGTLNGAPYLDAQLASLSRQKGVDWALWVSDDGSTDTTRQILRTFADGPGAGRTRLFDGPRAGAAANYLWLVNQPDLPARPLAFCDQDDIWDDDKLARALAQLGRATGPALYGAETRLLGAVDRRRRIDVPPSFRNALVQNIVAGNTAVLNQDGAAALRRIPAGRPIPHHDWWLYLTMTALGGEVIRDPRPVLDYRQHGHNIMGAHSGPAARLGRLRLLISGQWGEWVLQNLAALSDHKARLTPDAAAVVDDLMAQRSRRATARALRRHGAHRASATETALIRALPHLGAFDRS